MDTLGGSYDAPDDGLDEFDLTESDFDAAFAAGEPVVVVGRSAHPQWPRRVEDYYTLQVSDSRTLVTSSGRWGESSYRLNDDESPLFSTA